MSFFESSTLWCCLIPICRSCSVVLFYLQLVGSFQVCSTTTLHEKIKDNEPSWKVKNVGPIWKEPPGESIRLMSSSIAIYIGKGSLRRCMLTGLDAPLYNHQFDRGENESMLNGLDPVPGLGLRAVGPLKRI